jgi:hypothetical protein
MNKQKQQKRQFTIYVWNGCGLPHESHTMFANMPKGPSILAEFIANLKVIKHSATLDDNSVDYIASKLERLCKMPSSYTFDLVELRSLMQYNQGIKYSPFEFTSIVVSSSKLFEVNNVE